MICLQLTFKHIHQKPPHNSRLLNIICHHSQQYSADMKPRVPLTEQRDRQTDRQTVPVTWFCSEYPLRRHMPAWHWATRTRAWTAGCISSSTTAHYNSINRPATTHWPNDWQATTHWPIDWQTNYYTLADWLTDQLLHTGRMIDKLLHTGRMIDRPATTHWPIDWLIDWLS